MRQCCYNAVVDGRLESAERRSVHTVYQTLKTTYAFSGGETAIQKTQCPSPPPFSYLSLEVDRYFLNHNVETKLSHPICENNLVQEKKKKENNGYPAEYPTRSRRPAFFHEATNANATCIG